jgi:hypothetical protein
VLEIITKKKKNEQTISGGRSARGIRERNAAESAVCLAKKPHGLRQLRPELATLLSRKR